MLKPNLYDLPPIKLVSDRKSSTPPTDFRTSRIAEYFRSRELSSNTQRAYNRAFNRFMEWSSKSWHEIKHQDLDRYKSYLKDQDLNPSTICQELSALKSLFKWLDGKQYIDRNPTSTLELPHISSQLDDKSIDPETIEQIKQSLIGDVRDLALFQVLAHALRRSEVCHLKISDYQDKSLWIRDAKHDSDRIVPLLDEAALAIEQYLIERETVETNSDSLFLSRTNHQTVSALSESGLYYICKQWFGSPNPHRFCHTLCAYLIENGMDSMLAMQITGHKSSQSFRRYRDRALQKKAAEVFRNL